MNTKNYKKHPITILDLSKRTVAKILRRANLPCSLCGWNEASCDIHHIHEKSKGGSDLMDNLICMCPNCHRKLHQIGDKFKTKDDLRLFSLDKTFSNWLDFYNPVSPLYYVSVREKHNNLKNYCATCDREISIDNIYCSGACAAEKRQIFTFSKDDVEKWGKEKLSIVEIGRICKVSDNAVRKRLKKMDLYDFFYSLKNENV